MSTDPSGASSNGEVKNAELPNDTKGSQKRQDIENKMFAVSVRDEKQANDSGSPTSRIEETPSCGLDSDNNLVSTEPVQGKEEAKPRKRRVKKKRTIMKTEDEDSIRSEADENDSDEHGTREKRERSRRRCPQTESRPDEEGSEDGSESASDYSGDSVDESDDEEFDDEEYLKRKSKSQQIKEKKLLTNTPGLKEIELGENSLIRYSPTDLAKAIRRSTHIQKLVLNEKNCDPVSFEILIEGLDKNESIVQLEFRRAEITKDIAVELYTALMKNTKVKKFCMKRCTFTDSGLAVLFIGLQHCRSVKHIAIESCNLSDHSSNIVASAIPLMQLQSIRLQNTHMTDKGMRFFLAHLAKATTLESINVSEEKISEKAMAKLVFGIQKCTNLVRLVLFDCGLDEVAIEVLAEAIELNEKLHSINLSKNKFGNEGADILIDLLKSNNAIKNLKCDGCRISRHEKRLLKDALRYNSTFLKSLFSPEVTLSILDSVGLFEQNPTQKS